MGVLPQKQKKILILSSILIGILLILIIAVAFFTSGNKSTQINIQSGDSDNKVLTNGQPQTSQISAPPFPRINVKTWQENAIKPRIQTSSRVYGLKNDFTEQYIKSLAKKIIGTENISLNSSYYQGIIENSNELSIFLFHKETGAFSYISSRGIPLKYDNKLSKNNVQLKSFILSLILDPTLEITASYKRKDSIPEITYYEIHRNWEKIGLPIYATIGLLNLDELDSLSSMTFTQREIVDSNIYDTSDNSNNYARQNDFNTMTLAVVDGGHGNARIVSLSSNLKQLIPSQIKTDQIISYDEALSKLKANQQEFILTSPLGIGQPDFNKVYTSSVVSANKGTISDSKLSYLEQPNSQSHYVPYYIFKGTTKLDSGFNTKFVAGVSAVKNNVYGISTKYLAQDNSQKQSTFENRPTIESTIAQTQPTIEKVKPTILPNDGCIPTEGELDPIYEFQSSRFGYLPSGTFKNKTTNEFTQQSKYVTALEREWYYIPTSSSFDIKNILYKIDQFSSARFNPDTVIKEESPEAKEDAKKRYGFYYEFFQNSLRVSRDLNPLIDELSRREIAATCPIRVTGGSPTIFVYIKPQTVINIHPLFQLTYSESPLSNLNAWTVSSYGNILKINNLSRDYIYYEYYPISFERPPTGWNIKKTNLPNFAEIISDNLALKSPEKERLLFELKHASWNINSENLFIGVIPEYEVNEKLPLSVVPSIHIKRFHFYVGTSLGQKISAPNLEAIERKNEMLLELGASSGQ